MADGDNEKRPEQHQAASDQARTKPVIVAIGASAGGVQALQAFFEALPGPTGAAFVVVVHLDPQRRSELSSILASRTLMSVKQVEKTAKLEADHVYVIAPDLRLQLVDHEISAAAFDEPRGQRSPIDLFFRSVAERLGDGFAVILSGAGADGTIGVRAVKEAGGIILVQDPSEAEYSSMPRSAIATGVADFVLPVRKLAQRLVDLIRIKESVPITEAGNIDDEMLRRILAHVRVRTGHDFSKYKRTTVLRRIARRMQVTRTDNLHDYYSALRDNPEEAEALLGDLLISVTTFFRDSEAFEAVTKQVLPGLFTAKDPTETLRVWVSGCATGEEAYTIAILLLEEAARHELRPPIQVFGSDLDARALAFAREGVFPVAIEADVSEERLRRFFVREGEQYRVKQEVRDVVLFALHDFLKDPPFSRVDFISCRNVLIYLDRELQEQVCGTFHYALNPGGFLLLGSSETAENPPGLFRAVNRTARIYQSMAQPGDKPRALPRLLGHIRVREHATQVGRALSPAVALSEAALHRRMIERVAPPSILVDETHRVVHLSDTAGRYILPSGGTLSGDIVDLVRPELRFELRSSLHGVFEQLQSSLSLPMLVRFNGASRRVFLLVKPAQDSEFADTRHALVMFIEGEGVEEGAEPSDRQSADETVRRLTQELEVTQARLRTVREESDAANEELRAANEELQSINEEYRSTSEELETSKEELQSINEELQTVNSELKHKLEAISRAHSDLQNLMAATDLGTLFLDGNLRIKRFTQPVTELFSITPSDEGRPITDFAHRLEYDDLVKDAQVVLARLAPIRREIRSQTNRWYDVRLRPYRTVDDKIDGVVITFVDVTDRLQVEQALRESEQLLRQEKRLVELSREPIFIWDFDGGILEWNRGSEELYGYSRQEALGKRKDELLRTVVPGSTFADLRIKLLDDSSWNGELRQKTKDGRELIVESRIVLETMEGRRLALESTRNITERKLWEQRQQLLLGELTHRVKNTLAVVQGVAHQTMRSTSSSKDFVERFDGRLAALARAHNLLVESEWKGADLGALARNQLEPYAGENSDRLQIGGEPVSLPADLATPFGLILHELATNAAKHGSLSRPNGSVRISWTLESRNNRGVLTIIWKEMGGPSAKKPKTAGFGTALIDNGIPNARVSREFGPDGLVCTIELPLPEAVENGTAVQA
ncbi:MAG: PAS domain-containing protein [Methylobacteriaceae bacterium]|nr:PAS domain-containing protein [Methylobacteriaceae bacterium]